MNHAKSRDTIPQAPCMTIKMAAMHIVVHSDFRKTLVPPFKFHETFFTISVLQISDTSYFCVCLYCLSFSSLSHIPSLSNKHNHLEIFHHSAPQYKQVIAVEEKFYHKSLFSVISLGLHFLYHKSQFSHFKVNSNQVHCQNTFFHK